MATTKTSGTYSAGEACELLGISRNHGYILLAAEPSHEQAEAGLTTAFPAPVIHVGHRYRIPVVPLNRLLGMDVDQAAALPVGHLGDAFDLEQAS